MAVLDIDLELVSSVADSVGESVEQFVTGAVEERCNWCLEKDARELLARILQRLMSQMSPPDSEALATAYLDGWDADALLKHLK